MKKPLEITTMTGADIFKNDFKNKPKNTSKERVFEDSGEHINIKNL